MEPLGDFGHALQVDLPEGRCRLIVSTGRKRVLERRQWPVGEAAIALEPLAGGGVADPVITAEYAVECIADRAGEGNQDQRMQPNRQ